MAVSDIGCLATQASVEKEATAFMDSLRKLQVNRKRDSNKDQERSLQIKVAKFYAILLACPPKISGFVPCRSVV